MNHTFRLSLAALVLASIGSLAQAQYPNGNYDPNVNRERARARRAAVQAARAEQDRAQQKLTAARVRVQATWEGSGKLADAEKAVEAANEAFEAAQKPVIDKLKQNPEYAKALAEEREAEAKIAAERGDDAPSTQPTGDDPAADKSGPRVVVRTRSDAAPAAGPGTRPASDEQIQAAADKLNNRTKRRDMEAEAVENDAGAKDAKAKLDAAKDEAKKLNDELDAFAKNDPEYKAALDELANAKARVTAAASQN